MLRVLAAAEVPSSRVYSIVDMFADPQCLVRDMLIQASLPDGKPFRMPGILPKLSETPGSSDWIGPELGEHTDAVLADLGYDPGAIVGLREGGAV